MGVRLGAGVGGVGGVARAKPAVSRGERPRGVWVAVGESFRMVGTIVIRPAGESTFGAERGTNVLRSQAQVADRSAWSELS